MARELDLANQDYGLPTLFNSANTILTVVNFNQDIFFSAASIITAPNNGFPGWRSGIIQNPAPLTTLSLMQTLLTLAVPNGYTLNGTLNGTVSLFPRQKARLIQTGATAFIVDYVDRCPFGDPILIPSTAPVASFDIVLPIGYNKIEIPADIGVTASGASIYARFSNDNGVSVKAGGSDYGYVNWSPGGSGQGANSILYLSATNVVANNPNYPPGSYRIAVSPGNVPILGSAGRPQLACLAFATNASPAYVAENNSGYCGSITDRATTLRIFASSGNVYGIASPRYLI